MSMFRQDITSFDYGPLHPMTILASNFRNVFLLERRSGKKVRVLVQSQLYPGDLSFEKIMQVRRLPRHGLFAVLDEQRLLVYDLRAHAEPIMRISHFSSDVTMFSDIFLPSYGLS